MHHAQSLVAFLAAAGLGLASGSPLAASPARPDLTVDLAAPAPAAAGTDIGPQIRLIVKNVGRAVAPGPRTPDRLHGDLTLGREPWCLRFPTYSPNLAEDVLLKGGASAGRRIWPLARSASTPSARESRPTPLRVTTSSAPRSTRAAPSRR